MSEVSPCPQQSNNRCRVPEIATCGSAESDRQAAQPDPQNLPKGYEEAMTGGVISYQVPLGTYPDTYNKRPLMYAGIAARKNHTRFT